MIEVNITDRNGTCHQLSVAPGAVLMEVLRDQDMVAAICGGQCACATCHCWLGGQVGERDEDELDLLESLDHFDPARSRLTCQVTLDASMNGLELTVAPEE